MNSHATALILVGYQNDCFGCNGLLHQIIEESSQLDQVVKNTVELIKQLPSSFDVLATPIHFTANYEELVEPIGILRTIKQLGALQLGKQGAEMIAELMSFQKRIVEIKGRRGFNAFLNTSLEQVLRDRNINRVAIAGAITSLCVDSTARAAYELGYDVIILSDCTVARTSLEQKFYSEQIFPLYAEVMTYDQLLNSVRVRV